jgi:hypothetical protein
MFFEQRRWQQAVPGGQVYTGLDPKAKLLSAATILGRGCDEEATATSGLRTGAGANRESDADWFAGPGARR